MQGEPNKDALRICASKLDAVAGAAAAISVTAVATKIHVLETVEYSYGTTPTGGKLTIASGSTTLKEVDVPAAVEGQLQFWPGIHGSINETLVVTLAAGGGAVQAKLNITYR